MSFGQTLFLLLICVFAIYIQIVRMRKVPPTDIERDWMSTLVFCAFAGYWGWWEYKLNPSTFPWSLIPIVPCFTIAIWKFLSDVRKSPPQFSLVDLFTVTAVFATYFAIARYFDPEGFGLLIYTLLAAAIFIRGRKWQLKRQRERNALEAKAQ
jgi:hypothetical protein